MPFEKGKSGNPAGRPKVVVEFQLRARRVVDAHVIEAWEREVVSGGDAWVKCSELLAAYAYGKPKDSIELSQDPSAPISHVVGMGPEDLVDFAAWRIERRRRESLQNAQPAK